MIELGLPPLKALVVQRQRNFFKKMWAEREIMMDDPFRYAMLLARNSNNSTGRYMNNLIDNDFDDIGQSMNSLYQEVNNSQKSKCIYFKEVNPSMYMHTVRCQYPAILKKKKNLEHFLGMISIGSVKYI